VGGEWRNGQDFIRSIEPSRTGKCNKFLKTFFYKRKKFSQFCEEIVMIVPHSQSGVVPMSSLSGVGQLGFWEVGEGGTVG
jgi:hypothetical protein